MAGQALTLGFTTTLSNVSAFALAEILPLPGFQVRSVGRGKPPLVMLGRSRSSPGAKYTATAGTPAPFTAPHKPAKGAPSAVRGTTRSSPGSGTSRSPRRSTPPGHPARGTPKAVRGTSRSSPGAPYVYVGPPIPSPSRCRTSLRRVHPRWPGKDHRPVRPVHRITAVHPAYKPARSQSPLKRGTSRSSPGAEVRLLPVGLQPPGKPSRVNQLSAGVTSRRLSALILAPLLPSPFICRASLRRVSQLLAAE